MAPKKRRGRKLMDEAPSTHSFEISNASGAGECGEGESDVVSSSLNQEEQPAAISPVVGDRKLSSAVLVLENCLLPNSQRASITSPGSLPLEGGPTPKLQPAPVARQRASSIPKDEAGDASFTDLVSYGVADKEEVELEPSLCLVPKPKRATVVRRKKQKLKTVLQIVPGQLDIGIGSSEAERNTCAMAERGVGIEASVMHRTNLELEAESLHAGDEKIFETEKDFVAVRKRKAGPKKERRAGKRRKSDHGAGTVGTVEPAAEDEENGTTWMVSPSGGDEERVILKRQRKVAVSQDLVFADVSGTGLLNADVRATPECPGYTPEFQNSSVAQDMIPDGEQTVSAVETGVGISRPDASGAEAVVKRRWTRKLGKRMAKNISLDVSETDAAEIAVLPVKKRTRFKRKILKPEENLEPSGAVVSATVSTRVTRSRSNGNGGTPLHIDSSQNVTVNTSEEAARTNLPGNYEETVSLQTMEVEGGSAGNREILEIENTEKGLLCDADLRLTGVETEKADIQLAISQETTPKTYTEPIRITSAPDSLNTGVVDNSDFPTEIAADSPTVGGYTIPSIREMSEQRDSVTQRSSDERVTAVPDWDDNALQKTNTSLPETISLHTSIEPAFDDQRGESSSLELFRNNENVVPAVSLDDGNEPLASDVVCLETPPPEKLLPCDDFSSSTGYRIKKPLSSNTDVNLCKSSNGEDLVFISSSASSTALVESGSLAVRDSSNEFSVSNRTDSVSDSCLDVTSKPIEAVLSSAAGPVSLSIGSDDVLTATELSSSVQATSTVPKVDGRNESGGEPSEICSEGTNDQNLRNNLSASDVPDTSKTRSDVSEAAEDLAGHSASDGLEPDAKTVTKDAPCNATDHKKSSEGVAAEEAGFVPLKKRRLRMAESASEFIAVDAKCGVTTDAAGQSSELCAQSAVSIGGSTTGVVREPGSASALSASTLRDADAIARQRKYVGAHVSTAGGLPGAVLRASQMGARAFALFIKPQKTWTPAPLDEQEASFFRELLKEKGYLPSMVVPHGSYLLNCGASNAEHLRRSREALVDDLRRCQLLGLSLFNFHPGSFTDPDSADECIDRVAESINYAHSIVPDVITVIENSCGEMNAVGGSFSQLKQIIDKVTDKSRIGICLDTCHAFASGYDLRAKSGYVRMMEDFDTTIGREFLKAVHINDSKDDLGSRLDHHASIGKGKIGLPGFQVLMADRSLENIPIILETPLSGHKHEIELLYSFVSSVE